MNRYIIVSIMFVFAFDIVHAQSFQPISTTTTQSKSFITNTKTAPKTANSNASSGASNNTIGKEYTNINCNKMPFKVQVVAPTAKSLNDSQRKNIKIETRCIYIQSTKPLVVHPVSNTDKRANGVYAKVAIPKSGGWLDKFNLQAFKQLVNKSTKTKDNNTYIYSKKSCALTDKVMTFFVKSDGKTIMPFCGDKNNNNTQPTIDNIIDNGYNSAGGYNQNNNTQNMSEADRLMNTPPPNAQPTQNPYPDNNGNGSLPYGDPYNSDYLQQLQGYNPNGGITVGQDGDEDGTLGDELDDWGDDWNDEDDWADDSTDYGQEYGVGEGVGRASPDDANVYDPLDDEFINLDQSLYGGQQEYLTDSDLQQWFGGQGDAQGIAMQYQFDDLENFEYFDLIEAEAKIEEKFGGDWWLDFDPNLSFEQTMAINCNYASRDTCAYPNLTKDDYDLMYAITRQYNTSLDSWDFNSTYLEEPKKDEQSCSWFGSCWWQGLKNWWAKTNPASGQYDI